MQFYHKPTKNYSGKGKFYECLVGQPSSGKINRALPTGKKNADQSSPEEKDMFCKNIPNVAKK